MSPRDSIDGVVEIINEWVGFNVHGVVWARYVSDVSRDICIDRLRDKLTVPPIEFDPPEPNFAFDWLEEKLNAIPESDPLPVVCVRFPIRLHGDQQKLLDAIHSLNLRREDLIHRPLIQLWWIAEHLSPLAQDVAPDLVSWFKLSLTLREIMVTEQGFNFELLKYGGLLQVDYSEALLSRARREIEESSKRLNTSGPNHDVAMSLVLPTLSLQFLSAGHYEEALVAALQSVKLLRELDARHQTFLPDLAVAFNNLAIVQSFMGRQKEAVAAAEEAVASYRELIAKSAINREAFLPTLAKSLNNLSKRQSEVDQREAALSTAAEAVAIWRALAAVNAEAFLPDLARSLHDLANRQITMGQLEAAFWTVMEAVEHYRHLTSNFSTNREIFLPDFAMVLGTLSQVHAARNQLDEAKTRLHEALTIMLTTLEAQPQNFLQLTQQLERAYLNASQALNTPPDQSLLDLIAAKLNPQKQ